MLIREATPEDWPAVWPFFHEIVAAGETYPYPADTTYEQGREAWMETPSTPIATTVVAVDDDGAVVGSAHLTRNRPGNGGHVANASYMVDPARSGRGVGRALCVHSLDWARRHGYRAMQFNAVVETNTHAVRLYRSLGFTVVGTVPGAFHHPIRGYVGLHVMHRPL